MPRSLIACIVACCLVVAAGCRMCANPYDECGPMSGGCSQDCGSNVRAGSVLSGASAPVADVGDFAEWSGPIASPSDSAVVPAPQPKATAKPATPPAEGWKASKPSD